MAFISGKFSMRKILTAVLGIVVALLLASCGGGGGSAGTTGGGTSTGSGSSGSGSSTDAPTISIKLLDTTGAATSVITSSGPVTAKATVTSATGTPVSNTIVTFSTSQGFTNFAPTSAQVLTDANGVAEVTLSIVNLNIVETEGGSGDILTASATVGTTAVTGSASFSIGTSDVTLSIVAPTDNPHSLSAYGSTLIKANVLVNGAVYTTSPVVVNFTSPCVANGKATMATSATTVNGQAQVTYTDQGCSATDNVSISVAGAPALTETLNVAAPSAASIQFVSAQPAGDSIVIQGSGGNGRVETATLTFRALDTNGNALPNQAVNFALNSTQVVTLNSASGVTDSSGDVVVTVTSGSLPTTFRVIATLANTTISAISDSVTVTTGQPVQVSVTIYDDTPNIEGWNYDNVTTNVNILLADINGNPVADGTPVLFTTNSGSIGSSTNGGCLTTNGGCAVSFRSQNPRFGAGTTTPPTGVRAGMASINVSSTTSSLTLVGTGSVYMSGSTVDNPLLDIAGTWTAATGGGFSLALSTCAQVTYTMQLNDVNFNPMPANSSISASATTNAGSQTASIYRLFPATVPAVGGGSTVPANGTPEGSYTEITFTPGNGSTGTGACGSGTTSGTGEIDVLVTTPKGNETLIPVLITFPK